MGSWPPRRRHKQAVALHRRKQLGRPSRNHVGRGPSGRLVGLLGRLVAELRRNAGPGRPPRAPGRHESCRGAIRQPRYLGRTFRPLRALRRAPRRRRGPRHESAGPAPAPPAPAPPPAPPAPSQPTQEDDDVQVTTQQQGSTGAEVKAIQSILNGKAGVHLAVDGDFGGVTEAAVKAWQTFYRLEVDGIVGPANVGDSDRRVTSVRVLARDGAELAMLPRGLSSRDGPGGLPRVWRRARRPGCATPRLLLSPSWDARLARFRLPPVKRRRRATF